MTTLHTTPSHHSFARGCSSLIHIQPEGWVRAKASFDTDTGEMRMTLGLETDVVDQGPMGRATAAIYDAKHRLLATLEMGEPAKLPGKALWGPRIDWFESVRRVPPDVAIRATSIEVRAEHVGQYRELFGINLAALEPASRLLVH
jgi:hypothetical protein